MSLWHAGDCFRILDEFDVFMDVLNRKISMGIQMAAVSLPVPTRYEHSDQRWSGLYIHNYIYGHSI